MRYFRLRKLEKGFVYLHECSVRHSKVILDAGQFFCCAGCLSPL